MERERRMATKTCPRCAERVKAAAQVCRYCGHEFGVSLAKDEATGDSGPDQPVHPLRRPGVIAALVAVLLAAVIGFGYLAAPDVGKVPASANSTAPLITSTDETAEPTHPAIAIGQEFEWSAEKYPDEVIRQAGPMTIRIGRRTEEDSIAPVVTVSDGTATATMTGEAVSDSYVHRIGVFQNTPGGPPAILLQSFSGGAHCCNHLQMVEAAGDGLRTIDLGSFDGDQMALPADISGEGVADFVTVDQGFLYAFTAYAMSYAPPRILNVIGGRVVDISTRPAFARLFRKEIADAGKACRTDEDGAVRNGACAAYVAAAARAGGLQRAWDDMLAHYDPSQEWEYPTGCAIEADNCPDAQTIKYDGYPDALLAFLKTGGYIPQAWMPASASAVPDEQDQVAESAPTEIQ